MIYRFKRRKHVNKIKKCCLYHSIGAIVKGIYLLSLSKYNTHFHDQIHIQWNHNHNTTNTFFCSANHSLHKFSYWLNGVFLAYYIHVLVLQLWSHRTSSIEWSNSVLLIDICIFVCIIHGECFGLSFIFFNA